MTGIYDPALNLIYWGTGNPGPDLYGNDREGDNLYTDSVVALDADTGTLKWHYQFTPHDTHDWDATQVPVLAETTINGVRKKTLLFANRNGFYYTLDRTNGELLAWRPFVKTTWAETIGAERPARRQAQHRPDRERHRGLSRHHRRHQLHVAGLQPEDRPALRDRARGLRDLLRLGAGVRAPASTTSAAPRSAPTAASAPCARSTRPPAACAGSSSTTRRRWPACCRPSRAWSSAATWTAT